MNPEYITYQSTQTILDNNHFNLKTLSNVNQLNSNYSLLVDSFFINIAMQYGYTICNEENKVEEAKDFLRDLYYEVGLIQDLRNHKIVPYDSSHDFCLKLYKSSMEDLFKIYQSAIHNNRSPEQSEMLINLTTRLTQEQNNKLANKQAAIMDDSLLNGSEQVFNEITTSKLFKRSLILLGLLKNVSNLEWHKASLLWALENQEVDLINSYIKHKHFNENLFTVQNIFESLNLSLPELLLYIKDLKIEKKVTNSNQVNKEDFLDQQHVKFLLNKLYPDTKINIFEIVQDEDSKNILALIKKSWVKSDANLLKAACLSGNTAVILEYLDLDNHEMLVEVTEWLAKADSYALLDTFDHIGRNKLAYDPLEKGYYQPVVQHIDNILNARDDSLLYMMARHGSKTLADYLFERGCFNNYNYFIRQDRITPLMIAIKNNHMSIATWLISMFTYFIYDNEGNNFFHYLAKQNSIFSKKFIKALCSVIGDENNGNYDKKYSEYDDDIISLIKRPNYLRKTPINIAAANDNLEFINAIVKMDFDFKNKITDPDGKTPLFHSISTGNVKLFKMLWNNDDINIYKTTSERQNILHEAASLGQTAIANIIISDGRVPVHAPDSNNQKPIDIAIKSKSYDIALTLLENEIKPSNRESEQPHIVDADHFLSAATSSYSGKKVAMELAKRNRINLSTFNTPYTFNIYSLVNDGQYELIYELIKSNRFNLAYQKAETADSMESFFKLIVYLSLKSDESSRNCALEIAKLGKIQLGLIKRFDFINEFSPLIDAGQDKLIVELLKGYYCDFNGEDLNYLKWSFNDFLLHLEENDKLELAKDLLSKIKLYDFSIINRIIRNNVRDSVEKFTIPEDRDGIIIEIKELLNDKRLIEHLTIEGRNKDIHMDIDNSLHLKYFADFYDYFYNLDTQIELNRIVTLKFLTDCMLNLSSFEEVEEKYLKLYLQNLKLEIDLATKLNTNKN